MNYGDPQQNQPQHPQQQYYMQRMGQPQQQQHRMVMPAHHQQQVQPPPMMVQQPQQIMRQPTYGSQMLHPQQQPQPQQQMMRMPQQMMAHQQQMNRNAMIMQNLPPEVQQQISAEKDPERKRQIIQAHLQRQQQQQLFNQQMGVMQQGGMRMPMGIPNGAISQTTQRMPMGQMGAGMMYATGPQIQPQMAPQQQHSVGQQPGAGPVHIQRVPSQGSFVGQSPGQMAAGQQGLQPQMYAAAAQVPAGSQIRAQLQQPMPIGHPQQQQQQQQFVQQHIQQQMHKQQFAQQVMPPHQPIKPDGSPLVPQMSEGPGSVGAGSQQNIVRMQGGPLGTQQQQYGQQLAPMARVETPSAPVRSVPPDSVPEQRPDSVGGGGGPASLTNAAPAPQPQQVNTEEPEYKAKLKLLCEYHTDVKRLLARFELDNLEGKLKASLVNVIQVMEGTRRKGGPVTKSLLDKLLDNVKTVLYRLNISRHLLGAARKLAQAAAARDAAPATTETPFAPDPWREVRHLQIKIPDSLAQILRESERTGNEGYSSSRKRTHPQEDHNGYEPPMKRSLFTAITESFSTPSAKVDEEGKGDFRIRCLDGSQLALNAAICAALREAVRGGFQVRLDDGDMEPPISSKATSVHLRFLLGVKKEGGNNSANCCEGKGSPLSCKALDVLLPVDYPHSSLQFFPSTLSPFSPPEMDALLEQIDSGGVDMNSIGDLLAEWRNCVMEHQEEGI